MTRIFVGATVAGLMLSAVIAAPAAAALQPAVGSTIARFVPLPMATTTDTNFNVAGIRSYDELGAAINARFSVSLAPDATLVGIGWDVTLFADAPSWLSEMVVAFGSTSSPYNLFLTPGFSDDFPGTRSYSSGGVVDLVGLGLDFSVDADGILRLEFFEDFVDYPGDWDGIWQRGTLTFRYTVPNGGVIPEPGTWAMLIAGFGLVGAALRRRRAAAA